MSQWWHVLEPEFHRRNERFEMSLRERLQVSLTAAGDVVTRTFAGAALSATALPLGFTKKRLERLHEDGEFYGALADKADPKIFRAPEGGVHVSRTKAKWPYFHPTSGRCEDLRFESAYEPLHPDYRSEYVGQTKNRFAHARHWFHADGPRPTVVAIHGFTADLYALNEWFFALPWLYELGCDVVLFTLPFHGRRSATLAPFSGHGFFAGGIAGVNEAFLQAVHDFRVLVDHLTIVRGVEQVGVTGVSLGGYTSALLAAIEPRLVFSVPNVPIVSVLDTALEWRPVGDLLRALMAWKGLSIAEVRRWLALTSPLTYAPLVPKERRMIIGGIGDRLASPQHSRELWRHWDECRIHWFHGSHILHLDRGAYLRETARLFGSLGVVDKTKRRQKRKRKRRRT